jgi:hypothetical protein
MINIKSYTKGALSNMRYHENHIRARALATIADYITRVCEVPTNRGKLMSHTTYANMLITIGIFSRDEYERLCIGAAHTFRREVIDAEFTRNMGKYVDFGEAWLPLSYSFMGPKEQAAMRVVAKYGVDRHGKDNVDREGVRLSAQNIYAMIDLLMPLKRRMKLQGKMKMILCGISRTKV